MSPILINIDGRPVKTKIICYFTKRNGNTIELWVIKENFYNHPDSDGYALIPKIEEEYVTSCNAFEDINHGEIFLLEYIQNINKFRFGR